MRVVLEGDCSVRQATSVRQALMEALGSGGDLELDLGGVIAVDYSFFQLMHALQASCRAKGLSCALSGLSPETAALARHFGLQETDGER